MNIRIVDAAGKEHVRKVTTKPAFPGVNATVVGVLSANGRDVYAALDRIAKARGWQSWSMVR
jgi:hypothetical protein